MKFKQNLFIALFIVYLLLGAYPALTDKLSVHLWFNQFHSPLFDSFFKYITYLGDGFGILIFTIIFLFIEYRFSLLIFLGGFGSGLVTQILKRLVFDDQARPSIYFTGAEIDLIQGVDLHQQFSFPSGHSTSAFALFYCLSMIIKKPIYQALFFLLAFVASISRIYLHQHFFRDTYAGAVIGVVVCFLIYQYVYPKFSTKSSFSKSLFSPKTRA